jgi:predicted enzyme related to lactoylglutathione lyase
MGEDMKRVTGIGGIFFKSDDPEKLYQWYENHLGIHRPPDGTGAVFEWREVNDTQSKGMTVWSIFPRSTKYFAPSHSRFMINCRVENLGALLEALNEEGVQVDPHREDYDYGRFAWIMDLEGHRIELWEPPKK